MDNNVIVDGITLPPPAQGGIVLTPQLIWSSNAGRVANAEFVGDIKAQKLTGTITWEGDLTYAEMRKIVSAFSHLGKPFFSLTFTDELGVRRTLRCYSTGVSSTIRVYRDAAGNVTGVSVQFVEK